MLKFCLTLLVVAGFLEIVPSEKTCLAVREYCYKFGADLNIPGTEEQLAGFCRALQRLMECLIDFKTRCDPDFPQLTRMEDMLPNLGTVCTADNPSYAVVAKQIGCIRQEILTYDILCDPAVDDVESALAEMGEDLGKMDENYRFGCVHGLKKLFCLLETIGKECHSAAAAALFDIAKKVEYPFDCPEEIIAKLPDILKTIVGNLKKEAGSPNKNLMDTLLDRK